MPTIDQPRELTERVESHASGTPDALNETAQKILQAAKTIIADEGYGALTLRAINRKAGVANMGAAGYYFGSKARVVEAIIREVITEYAHVAFLAMPPDASLEQRINALNASLSEYDKDDFAFLFFEILPHALRDEELRTHLADQYLAYFKACVEYLFPGDISEEGTRQRLEYLAQDVAAFQDGILLQALIFGEHYDLRSAYERLGRYMLAAAREVVRVDTA